MFSRPRTLARFAATAALALTSFSVGLAATTDSARPKPISVATVGTMRVEAYGTGSPALIFIPGLSCGSWVWDDAVRTYEKSHAVYVVTLAGFDGLPAKPGPAIDAADASLSQLLTTYRLDRPIVIGHSLGGYLALRFGSEHSDLVRGIVSVDGLPVFPALLDATSERRREIADATAASISKASAAEFAEQQRVTIATMVTDPARARQVAELSSKSDPAAVGTYAGELFASDLRPQMKMLTAPTLEIAPVPTIPTAYEGPGASTKSKAERAASYVGFYASLFPGTPRLEVVPISDSLHFVMIDQPKALYDAITAFVAASA
jgi:pimeloyl-ACP methyl ester carboxylesterase